MRDFDDFTFVAVCVTQFAQRAEQIGVRDVVLKPNTVAEIGQLIRDRLDALKN